MHSPVVRFGVLWCVALLRATIGSANEAACVNETMFCNTTHLQCDADVECNLIGDTWGCCGNATAVEGASDDDSSELGSATIALVLLGCFGIVSTVAFVVFRAPAASFSAETLVENDEAWREMRP
ncbi:hypothetical protein DIPPA_07216 [Diplonema papillatum]|nr:hypothetical protein DIPPA_07216 [Diplonema papillatum]KAJ9448118.1 hypothetical protein DIPPA_07216 [Diplonema papillatum]